MKFVRYDGDRLGLLTADETGVVDLTDRLGLTSRDPLLEYLRGDHDAAPYADEPADRDLSGVRLEAPVRRPGKVIAAPLNYEKHVEEAMADTDIPMDEWFTIEDKGYFLKAPSSVVGPADTIEIPFADRRIDHEVELAFVMAEDVKDVAAEDAWDAILGYTILLDISVRGGQDRSNRKSYDTFTVVGPCVATPDEVGDPQNLEMELSVNGEVRQSENTDDMIYTCADVVQYAAIGATVEAGDVITTGTPEGVGPLADGDVVEAAIEDIGSMTIDVSERDVRFADVNVQKGGQD